jgi:hypothetical protein
MAVVQISRVQVRRGRKNSGTSVPQLASGEMGWAIDSQELFIGNGSIQEGAPYVGNTKILTEHDNILDLALQYEYKRTLGTIQTGPTASQPVQRTFQERLDDTVSIRSFGAVGDGTYNESTDIYTFTTDDTLALQRAIDELYLNNIPAGEHVSESNRVVLVLEPGIFKISNSLKVPPYAVLRGAGKDKTIIVQTGDFSVFQTVGSTSEGVDGYVTLLNMTTSNQPKFIEASGMTLRTTTSAAPVMLLDATVDSLFDNIKFQSSFDLETGSKVELDSCLQMRAKSTTDITCKNNLFTNCDFVNAGYAVTSTYDIVSNVFDNCLFYNLGEAVYFGYNVVSSTDGKSVGPSNNKFLNSRFDLINERGINIIKGRNNLSQGNSYFKVGNDGGTSRTAATSVINFQEGSNVSDNDYFQRSEELTNKVGFRDYQYISEISGVAHSNHKYNVQVFLEASAINSTFVRLPGNASSRINLHYIYRSVNTMVVRQGTMYITVDKFNNAVKLTDEYDITGNSARFDSLSFTATLQDQPVPPAIIGDGNKETVYIKYTNTNGVETGYINYWYEILS